MGHDKGFPQPQFSQPEWEPQDQGAQATCGPEDAIVFEDAFETGLGEVKGEDEMKSKECVPDPTQLAQPHAPQLPALPEPNLMGEPTLRSHSQVQCDGPNGRIRTPQLSMYHMARISRFPSSTSDVIKKWSTPTDRGGQRGPHLKRRKPPSKKYLHSTGTRTQASMYGAPYIALGTTIAPGNTRLQAATGHEALGVLNSRVRRERGTKKSAHTGTKAAAKVLRWPHI